MNISIVAAVGKRGELGKDGKLPWRIPEDLKHFKSITLGQTVVMGRKTYESLPRKLEDRDIIILTTQEGYTTEGARVMHSVGEVMKYAYEHDLETLYVAGGGEVYKHFLPQTNIMHLTIVNQEFDADVFFPTPLNREEWDHVTCRQGTDNRYLYTFNTFIRRKKV